MKTMKWFGVFLLASLAIGSLNPLYAVDEQRQAYDKMVEEATREADEYVEEKKKEQAQAAEKKREIEENSLDNRVEAERERLEAEMEKVRARGLGPDFTMGMKRNRIKELETKHNQLISDPEAYFSEQ